MSKTSEINDILEDKTIDEPPLRDLTLIGRIRETLFGLKVENIKWVDKTANITPLPDTPPCLPGLVYFKGGIEAVIDFGILTSKDQLKLTPKTRTVFIEAEGLRGAILFDELLEMPVIQRDEIKPYLKNDVPSELVVGQIDWRQEVVLLISPAGLFKQIQKAKQERK